MSIMTPKMPKGFGMYSLPTMGGGQQDIYNMLKGQFQGGGSDVFQNLFGLAQGNSNLFEQLEAPAMQQFQQQIAPEIAQRYAGSGIGASSGMQNAIAGAGGNLAAKLQSQRMGLMERSMQNVLGLGEALLGTPTQQFGMYQKPQQPKWWQQALGIAAPIGGALLGGLLPGVGSLGGAKLGASIGGMIGKPFLS